MKEKRNSQKGSTTLEAAIIFPIVFFLFIALIYVGILIYFQVSLQAMAQSLAQKAGNITQEEILDHRKNGYEVHQTIHRGILHKTVTLEVQSTQTIPMEGLFEVFGMRKDRILRARCRVVVKDPVGFIRNTDFGMETFRGIKGLINEGIPDLSVSQEE